MNFIGFILFTAIIGWVFHGRTEEPKYRYIIIGLIIVNGVFWFSIGPRMTSA